MSGGEIAAIITAASGLILGFLRIRKGESAQRARIETLFEECKRETRRLRKENRELRKRLDSVEERLDRKPARRA